MKSSKTNHIDLLTVNQLLTNSTGLGSGSGSTGSSSTNSTSSTGSSSTGSTNRLTINLFSVMLFSLLTIGFFINGCAKQTLREGNDMKDRNNDGSYNIGYSFDGVISSKSNMFSVESEIKDAYLVFYKNHPDPSEQKYVAYQEVIINNNSTNFPLPIPGDLTSGDKYKVLILGNYNSNEAGGKSFEEFITELLLTNKTYTKHKRLFYSETVGRLSENLPFSGILQKIGDITEAESLFTCPDENTVDLGVKVKFTRSVSRFDIINNVADQLVITKVKVCNYRDEGYFYHSDGFKGSVVSGIEGEDSDGWLDVSPPAVIGGVGDEKQIVQGGLYGYPNLVPYPAQGDELTTCLIIEGYYQNEGEDENVDESTYYRANISRDGDPQLLYSNRIYTITINGVKDAGSVDANVAYLDTNNKLDYETDGDSGTGDDNSSVDDKGNYIIVSRTDIVFDNREDLYETITVRTKDNANWEVDWEGMVESPDFGFNKLDNNYLHVFTKGVNDLGTITKNGTIRLKLDGVLANVFVDIALSQIPDNEELSILTVDVQVGEIDVDVNKDGEKLRYPVSIGTTKAHWEVDEINSTLSFASSYSTSGAHNGYLTIDFEANLTGAEREGYIIIKRVPKNEVADVRLNFTQQDTDKGLIIYSSMGTELEGFRRNKADVRGYDEIYNGGIGHGSGSGGGFVYFNVGRTKQLYVSYNIILANPDDYTWEATTAGEFDLTDLGMLHSSAALNVELAPLLLDTVTGSSGESVRLFIHVTGPGDPDIEGTLTIKAIPKDVTITGVFEKQYDLTITTSCDIGETTTANLVWDDRNRGAKVPSKPAVAEYYANVTGGFVGNEDYKGDYYEWKDADEVACPGDWRLPSLVQLETLVDTDIRFSKTRAFVVSHDPDDLYVYTGAWFPLAGKDDGFDGVYGFYWSSTEYNSGYGAYSLSLYPTKSYTYPNRTKTIGYSVRCVKDVVAVAP